MSMISSLSCFIKY